MIYVVRGFILSHLFIPSYEKLCCFQDLTRLSLRLNHFCIFDFKINFQNERKKMTYITVCQKVMIRDRQDLDMIFKIT